MGAIPSLAEIAAMPFPASQLAMRKHYDPLWGKLDSGDQKAFSVTIKFSIRETDERTYLVEAANEDDAKILADEMFDKDNTIDTFADVEVDDVIARPVGEA